MSGNKGRWGRLLKRLSFAGAVFVLLMALVEGSLRVWPVTRNKGKIFLRAPNGRWTFQRTDSGIFFEDPKPAGVFRIMCFGESAVEGSIYNPLSTFPNHLRLMLLSGIRSGRVEVINCGQTGLTSTDVLDIFMAAFRFQPDLMVVYCGNNELTHYKPINRVETPLLFPVMHALALHSRLLPVLTAQIYSLKLRQGGARILEEVPNLDLRLTIFPQERREHIERNFVMNIEDVVRAAKQNQVPLILSTVAGNLRDWPPQRSRYPASMPVKERLKLEQQCREAEQALDQGQYGEARGLLDDLLAKAPDHARAHFWRGRLELAAGDLTAARQEFILAQDQDDSGLNRPQTYDNDEAAALALKYDVPLIDIARIFDEHSPYGLTGFELINDGCHPTIDGQVLLAACLARFISQERPDLFTLPDPDQLAANKEQWLRELNVTPEFMAKRVQEMAFNLGFGYDDRLINGQAIKLFHDLTALTPDSTLPEAAIGLLRLRQDDPAAADAFTRALRKSPAHLGRMCGLYLKHYLRWMDPYLLVRSRPGTEFHYVLGDYLEATGVVEPGEPYVLPLADADKAYRFDVSAGTLVDVTAPLAARLAERKQARARAGTAVPIMLYGEGRPRGQMTLQRLAPSSPGEFLATGPDPFLVFSGLSLTPLALDRVSIRAAVSPVNGPIAGELCVYWKRAAKSAFGEDCKACVPLKPGDAFQDYTIDLSDDPDWLMSTDVDAVRLDPGEGKVKLELSRIEFSGQ
ncbi:MAG TPA: tetratricopeptide repeat protein [bacterium]|nr:tetratricopeptide repeat protein [bacterium]